MTQESLRLQQDASREQAWKRWGPYLSDRQWGTVREDYSARGNAWEYFPHDHARSRAYRWGEDGLLGICDRQGRLCFALALWNERDPILKERLFGLTGNEGNHGEDVKECYFYLDSTPTHAYMKALYKYPQRPFPYSQLVDENRRRGKQDLEFELADTGVFVDDRYFDVVVEYAKAAPNDILIRVVVNNRGADVARLHVLPTLWFRNTWSWGRSGEGYWSRPELSRADAGCIVASHESLGTFALRADPSDGVAPAMLFTENETNHERLFNTANGAAFVKDAFHEYVVHGRQDAVNPASRGTKGAYHYVLDVAGAGMSELHLRLTSADIVASASIFGDGYENVFVERRREADEFYDATIPVHITGDARNVVRQVAAGLLWSKQFYHYVVKDWCEGDPTQPSPPPERAQGRNHDWNHLYNRDVISMPDKWEYPWYAAWDLAFHMIPFAKLDPEFAKAQMVLFLREWYMHPSGQLPAYEWALSDVNPPVHAWAAWRVYKMTAAPGQRDQEFLARVFQKLLLNFTWWVNRKDVDGRHLFAGGFLGLDNIGAFDRSLPLPSGQRLEQADGTAWMAFYCATMLSIAIELAREDATYADMASKFFEHFVAIVDAMNAFGGVGLWDETDGFYYDRLCVDRREVAMPIRSMVGLLPLCAVEVLDQDTIDRLPGFKKRLDWFLANRPDLARHISYMAAPHHHRGPRRLLAIPSRERLLRVLRYMLDENEFLSPYGIRSVSRVHAAHPFVLHQNGDEHRVDYSPGESTTTLFGGNSNWRGPIWMPMNFLIVEALERYHHFYGDALTVECPTGSGRQLTLKQVAREISHRLASIFLRDARGQRPCHGGDARYADDPHWRDLLLFHEYFHGDTGRGCGANHQTGWTALAARFIDDWSRTL